MVDERAHDCDTGCNDGLISRVSGVSGGRAVESNTDSIQGEVEKLIVYDHHLYVEIRLTCCKDACEFGPEE